MIKETIIYWIRKEAKIESKTEEFGVVILRNRYKKELVASEKEVNFTPVTSTSRNIL